jgi:hypothetical protein
MLTEMVTNGIFCVVDELKNTVFEEFQLQSPGLEYITTVNFVDRVIL